jgi:hypothetical protein
MHPSFHPRLACVAREFAPSGRAFQAAVTGHVKKVKFPLRCLQHNIKPQPAHRTGFPIPVIRRSVSIRPLDALDRKSATPFHSQVSAHSPPASPIPNSLGLNNQEGGEWDPAALFNARGSL